MTMSKMMHLVVTATRKTATSRFVHDAVRRRAISSFQTQPIGQQIQRELVLPSSVPAFSTIQQRNYHNQVPALASTSSPTDGSNSNINSDTSSIWTVAAAATTFMVANSLSNSTIPSVTLNEESKSMNDNGLQDDEDGDDPYDNLPEEDEPTHCSICNTYRQGPCRPFWRKVERCTKDNEFGKNETSKDGSDKDDSSNSDNNDKPPVCMKYMLPWIECASGYRGLYALIEMDTNYSFGIADVENESKTNNNSLCWKSSNEPFTIDWSEWKVYVKENKWVSPTKAETSSLLKPQSGSANVNTNVSLWKTLSIESPNDDPVLVPITATMPRVEDDGVGILECAFALDQYGTVLGFAYGTQGVTAGGDDSKDSDSPNDEEESNSSSNEGDTNNNTEPEVPNVTLTIRLMPSHTSQITIGASYVRPSDDDVDDDVDDEKKSNSKKKNGDKKDTNGGEDKGITRLYKSRPISVVDNGSSSPS